MIITMLIKNLLWLPGAIKIVNSVEMAVNYYFLPNYAYNKLK
jgi:hypothetical protein